MINIAKLVARHREGFLERHGAMHDVPCEHCPSAHGPGDPESDDIRSWPRAESEMTLFVCAWRPEKLCRGLCDDLGVTAEDLPRIVERHRAEGET